MTLALLHAYWLKHEAPPLPLSLLHTHTHLLSFSLTDNIQYCVHPLYGYMFEGIIKFYFVYFSKRYEDPIRMILYYKYNKA